MKFGRKHLSLRTTISLFVSAVVVVSLLFTGLLIGIKQAHDTNQSLANKTMAIAEVVAHSPVVIEALEGKRNRADVQSFASAVQTTTGVRFIVVMDMNHIRLSHPNPANIGKRFVGGDEGPAMHGLQYVSVAKGTLGISLRAFVPIFDTSGTEVGVVSVGILLQHVRHVVLDSEGMVYLGIGIGLAVGIIGALVLATKIKRMLFGLEPAEIGKLWQERNALLESVREGVLAVNTALEIIVANAEAVRMFRRAGIHENPEGKDPAAYMPDAHFRVVLDSGQAEYDREYDVNGYTFVVNLVPIQVNNETIGVVATFRDKTELKHLAEQLTGVKLYAEALRAQTHEFMNRLHVILGLIHREQYNRLGSYISQITDRYQEEVGSVSGLVKDPVLAGFVLSKLSFARENGVQLHISGEGTLPEPKDAEVIDEIVTITGNLIDNAFEAVAEQERKEIDIHLIYEDDSFTFEISDSGDGVPDNLVDSIYLKGVSTKGENRGYGLFLVQRSVERLGGTLKYRNDADSSLDLLNGRTGATFTVVIPYERKGDSE